MYSISQARQIIDTHFRHHLAARHHRTAALTIFGLFILFGLAGCLFGWFFGYPFRGAIAAMAVDALFLATNGDSVDETIQAMTNSDIQKIVQALLSLPEEQQQVALNDIKRLGEDANYLLISQPNGEFGIMFRIEE